MHTTFFNFSVGVLVAQAGQFVGDKRVGGCKDVGHASLQCIDLMLRL